MNTNDTHEKFSPADPLITAYALGELEGDELGRIEAAVKDDPALQAAVAELRAFGGQLANALGEEPAVAVPAAPKKRARIIPFPLYYLATAAAAGFAVVVWMQSEGGVPVLSATKHSQNLLAAAKPPAPVGGALAKDDAMRAFSTKLIPVASPNAPTTKAPPLTDAGLFPAPAGIVAGSADGRMQRTDALAASAGGKDLDKSVQMADYVSADGFAPLPTVAFSMPSAANEAYAYQPDNDYHSVANDPLSTFSIDVDTASYANVRRFITGGTLPPRDAVRIEEMVNYFPYAYAPPAYAELPAGAVAKRAELPPFAAHLAVASAPWAPTHRLVRIALKGKVFTTGTRPAANLVFLLDVSGSMNSANKLPLVKESLRLLVERLHADDHVAIVTYASGSGLALPSTAASHKRDILAALDDLHAGGSTNGAMGIQLAYDVAKANFVAGGINRVILCTDGDFNVGITHQGDLVSLIQEKAKSRVFLSVFGFGMGNYKDSTLELLADKGNGAYGYIDTRREAEKVFVEQAEGTLATIAKDVKIQVEFNPARVQSYRLIGYENRLLKKEDFNNDAVDAGEIGAGHTVTALYEVVPIGIDVDGTLRPTVDPLKYQSTDDAKAPASNSSSPELLTVKVRYKAPEGDVSKKQEFPLVDAGKDFASTDKDFQFAAAVAGWGMLLRDSDHKGTTTYEQVLNWAENGLGDDVGGYRAEFMQLVRRSMELKNQ